MGKPSGSLRDLDSRYPWALDGLLAAALFAGAMIAAANPGPDGRPADVTSTILLAGGALPYVLRRQSPLVVLLVASGPVLALATLGYSSAVIGSGLFLAAYTVAALGTNRRTAFAAVYVLVLLAAVVVLIPRSMPVADLATNAALFAGAFAVGRSAHTRRKNTALLQDRAELAHRARVEEARRAVSDERLRIAQELHDVLAHSLGVIALQAGVGAHVIDADPAEAKESLLAVARTSRSALVEIRRMLSALRTEDDPVGYHPPPGLAALEDLAVELRFAGLPVSITIEGNPDTLPVALDLTAYRLVQEALTNVVKHAGPAHAKVRIRYEPGAVLLEVLDDGHATGTPLVAGTASGHGQLGMRERVTVWGGTLTAGNRPGGGYRIAARLPYPSEAP